MDHRHYHQQHRPPPTLGSNVLYLQADPTGTSEDEYPMSYEQMLADNYTTVDVSGYPMYNGGDQLIPQPPSSGGAPRQTLMQELHFHVHSAKFWRRVSIINSVGLVLLAIALIVIATHHHVLDGDGGGGGGGGDPARRRSHVRAVPIGGLLEPEPVAPAVPNGAKPLAYKFRISGMLARYPTDGGPVPKLDTKIAQKAQCCCTYREPGKRMQEVHTCATLQGPRSGDLVFRLQEDFNSSDNSGHLVVEAQDKMIGAECTLTWF